MRAGEGEGEMQEGTHGGEGGFRRRRCVRVQMQYTTVSIYHGGGQKLRGHL